MKDICVLYHQDDEKIINELSIELNLLGVRTDTRVIRQYKDFKQYIEDFLKDYSSILLLISPKFSEIISKKNIQLKRYKSNIIIVAYKVKKENVECINNNIDNIIVSKSKTFKSLVLDIVREMGNEERNIILHRSNLIEDIWDSPLHIYRKREGLRGTKEIIVDVTWSSLPTRPEPAPAFLDVLGKTLSFMGDNTYNILDFGAGKLRHTVILLEDNHKVTAVEYPELFVHPSPQIEDFLIRANNCGKRFGNVTYPSEFLNLTKKYDLILLINVLNIIPEPLERLFVLDQCNKKLKNNKFLIYFSQHGDKDQRNSASDYITDGGCTICKSRKTFYTECDRETVDLILNLTGFERVNINYNSGHNQAWLYQKKQKPDINIQEIAMNKREIIERKPLIGDGENEIIIADVMDAEKYIKIGEILYNSLELNLRGRRTAYKFEKIIEHVIKYIFKEHIITTEIESQYQIQRGRQRIDFKASWKDNSSLKNILKDNYGFKSSFIPIECKNYTGPLGNTEYSQIVLRCNKHHRHFGIIICRDVSNDNEIIQHLHDIYNDHGYLIIVFDDNDLRILLSLMDEKHPNPPWLDNNDNNDKIAKYVKLRIEEAMYNRTRRDSIRLRNDL